MITLNEVFASRYPKRRIFLTRKVSSLQGIKIGSKLVVDMYHCLFNKCFIASHYAVENDNIHFKIDPEFGYRVCFMFLYYF